MLTIVLAVIKFLAHYDTMWTVAKAVVRAGRKVCAFVTKHSAGPSFSVHNGDGDRDECGRLVFPYDTAKPEPFTGKKLQRSAVVKVKLHFSADRPLDPGYEVWAHLAAGSRVKSFVVTAEDISNAREAGFVEREFRERPSIDASCVVTLAEWGVAAGIAWRDVELVAVEER